MGQYLPSNIKWTALISAMFLLFFSTGCATTYLKGVDRSGKKLYMGPVPIENTPAYQDYKQSRQTEVDKQHYLFQRLKDSQGLEFYHDGSWYNALEAYRGGMWLMRDRYQKGQDTREFIRKNVERSDAGNLHLAKYPDGTMQIGSYVLYNELDLLEATAAKDRKA